MTVDLKLKIDFRSGLPIYVQVMDQIKHMIAAGELKIGDQLPTVRQLAADLRVNFNTVARAYRMLDQGEIISTQHGRGTFILEQKKKKNTRKKKVENIEELTRFYIRKATYLGFEPEEIRTCFEEMVERKDVKKTKE